MIPRRARCVRRPMIPKQLQGSHTHMHMRMCACGACGACPCPGAPRAHSHAHAHAHARAQVRLAVWSEHDNVDQLDWSMESLKQSMKWDEDTYGREYDLDVYHIVAVTRLALTAHCPGLRVLACTLPLSVSSTCSTLHPPCTHPHPHPPSRWHRVGFRAYPARAPLPPLACAGQ